MKKKFAKRKVFLWFFPLRQNENKQKNENKNVVALSEVVQQNGRPLNASFSEDSVADTTFLKKNSDGKFCTSLLNRCLSLDVVV